MTADLRPDASAAGGGIEAPEPPVDVHLDALPAGVTLASPWRRLAAALLELLLLVVTAIVGWLVWAIVVARRGQSPAKQLLGLRVIRPSHRRPAGLVWMVVIRGFVAPWFAALLVLVSLGAALFIPLWDRYNRTAIDVTSDCWVVMDRHDAYREDREASLSQSKKRHRSDVARQSVVVG